MTTPNLSLQNWEDNIEQPNVPFNLNAAIMDALVQGAIESVEDDAPTTVLGDIGKMWIVGTGTWPATPTLPAENDVAYCTAANVFMYLTPKEGWNLKDKDAGERIEFNGTAWVSAGGGGGGGGASVGVQYDADTGSTADSDPGAGLLKWNNATQASATFLYLDDMTDDGVSLAGWWSALAAGGFCYLQHATDQNTWQIWLIDTVVDATGYVKLGVTLVAEGGAFADGNPMLVTLQQGPTTPGPIAWGGIVGTLSDQTDLQAELDAKGPAGIPQNSQSADYTLVLSDANKHIYHPPADTTGRTWTIPANGSVAFPIGTAITFDNDFGAGAITIAITTDALVLVGAAGSTGSRTLASGGQATAIKVTSTRWRINGTELT